MTSLLRKALPPLLLMLLLPAGTRAEVPAAINYQGRVLGAGGSPAPGPVDIEIGIWDQASGGTRLYREQHLNTPLAAGVFDLRIGEGSNVQGGLDAAFSKADRWLELTIDGETLAPRQPFSSVAYALRAGEADRVGGLAASAIMPRAGGNFTGSVRVLGANGNGNILLGSLGSNPDHGFIAAQDATGDARAQMFVAGSGQGVVSVYSATDTLTSAVGGGANGGLVSVYDSQGTTAAFLAAVAGGGGLAAVTNATGDARAVMSTANDSGAVLTLGPAGNILVMLAENLDAANHGQISVHQADSAARASMYVDANGGGSVDVQNAAGDNAVELWTFNGQEGVIVTRGPNGRQNVVISSVTDRPNNGAIAVLDANGNVQAGMVVNASGRGEIFADVKNFVVDHPNRPGTRIVYSSLEGPEVAIYHRGIVPLAAGRGTIVLPEHFAALASPETVTVQLTPASLDSLGVAVGAIADGRIDIGELHGGRGSYDVHFVVHALRRGYEDRSPLVEAEEADGRYGLARPATGDRAGRPAGASPRTDHVAAARAAAATAASAGAAR